MSDSIQQMQAFFHSELKTLALKTGIEQAEAIYRTASTPEEAREMINTATRRWAEVCCQPPFDRISVEAKKRIIQDQMIRDESFVRAPFGQLPGFNDRILWKWLTRHYEQHESTFKNETEADKQQAYANYVKWCHSIGSQPLTFEEAFAPMTDEKREKYVSDFTRMITQIAEPQRQQHPIAERFGKSILPEYLAQRKKQFEIEGNIIEANTEEEAIAIYSQNC